MIDFWAKVLDVVAGVIILTITLLKWRQPKGSVTMRELIKELEEKDREIEKLIMQHKAWKMRYDHRTKECEKQHLQL